MSHASSLRLFLFFLLLVFSLTTLHAQSFYPFDLVSKIRFYHLQEPYYHFENERALTQCEHYLAQDLAESIEDVCFVVGMTSNPLFLPTEVMTTFEISQRFGHRFHFISTFQLQAMVLQRAYDIFMRQRTMDSSAIQIDELEADWTTWWNLVQRSIPPTHLQFLHPIPPAPTRRN